ncbi:MAG: class II aldolase/adducin family protein [Burkholderiales bacterium]|nr:class II aldolase/adducin family protein [Burkholderiales bacterium]
MQLPSLKHVVSEDEWKLRVNLAACYRLVAMYGWSDLIFTHISAKLPESVSGKDHHFLINPYGLMFDEITASSLLKIDLQGKQINESSFYVNHAGFVIHSTIHDARHDAVCVLHTHSRAGVAVSAQKEGLLPISQQSSLLLSSLAYHDYEGLAVHDDERDRLKADLGDSKYMILRNHGLLTVGCSVPDAFLAMYFLETSCQIQISAQAGGTLSPVPQKVLDGVTAAVRVQQSKGSAADLAWPALLRRLDRLSPGYDS